MARRVDQIQRVSLPITRFVGQCSGLRLNGDAALPLQSHRVQDLGLHLAIGEPATQLNDAISERAFAMVDVGNN